MRKVPTWLQVLAVNLVVFFLLFGAMEIAVRLAAPDYVNAYFMEDVTRGRDIHLHEKWRHRVRADQVDAPLVRARPAEKRVLFLGDSIIFGYGLDYEDTLQEVAAEHLDAAGCRLFLHGVGRMHSNLVQLLASEHRDYVLDKFGADLIVYQFNVNDVTDPDAHAPRHDENLTLRERFEKFRISYLNRSAFVKWTGAYALRLYERSRKRSLRDLVEYSPARDPLMHARAWEHFERSLVDTKRLLAQRGIGFAILVIPESYQISDTELDNEYRYDLSGIDVWPTDRVMDIARRRGIPALDVTDALRAFRREHPGVRLYFPGDANHPNLQGHRLIGREVAGYLAQRSGLCPR